MLLATASYALPCHASSSSSSSGNSNSTAPKLSRSTASNQSSQKVATTTAVLMKTISVRGNRNGGIPNEASVQKSQQQQQQLQNKINANTQAINDNLKKTVAAGNSNANTTTNNHKNATKHSTAANVKPTASTANTASSSTSSSSATVSLKATIPTASFLKTYTVPPTTLHRSSKARLRSCSINSLHDEMCHFKPIRTLPLTPLKSGTHSRGGFSLKAPKPRLCTSSKNCDFTAIKRVIDRENPRGKLKSTRKNDARLSSSIFQTMKPHLSAFVRLQPNALNDLQDISNKNGNTSPITTIRNQKKNSKSKTPTKTATTAPAKSRKAKATTQPNAQRQRQPQPQRQQKGKSSRTSSAATTRTSTTTTIANKNNSTNSRKRKAQTNFKQSEATEIKKLKKVAEKTKIANANRKTPPLTRGRKRQLEGYDAPLV